MNDIGVVCEGGGLRGLYTSGVLDYFLERSLHFNYLVGVSAGAIYPASYVSKQKGRNLEIQKKYLNDKRYMSFRNYLKSGNYIDPEFAYYRMTSEFVPLDYNTFKDSQIDFKVGVFNCLLGKTDFIAKKDFNDVTQAVTTLLASGSLPFISKEVYIDNTPYLDGGIASPIPIDKSIEDKNKRHIVILTQNEGYQKKALSHPKFTKLFYRKYPKVAKALIERHDIYNSSLSKVERLYKNGDVFLIRPSKTVQVSRLEKNVEKIEDLYNLGYEDAKKIYNDLIEWISR